MKTDTEKDLENDREKKKKSKKRAYTMLIKIIGHDRYINLGSTHRRLT